MSYDEHPDESMLAAELRGSLARLTVAARPPATAIASRGRGWGRQRRRVAGLAGLGLSGAVAGTALALSLTGVLGTAPAPGAGAGTIRTDAFTLTSNANGTDTLTISHKTLWNPARLRQALAAHHIPALVTTGFVNCESTPAPINHAITSTTSHGRIVMTINPAAIPAGAELYFSESDKIIFIGQIWTRAYTCS